jgi:hypothetical protein
MPNSDYTISRVQMKVDLLTLKYFHCTRCVKEGRPNEYFPIDSRPPRCKHGRGMFRRRVFITRNSPARGPWTLIKIPGNACESINLAEAYMRKHKDFVKAAYD